MNIKRDSWHYRLLAYSVISRRLFGCYESEHLREALRSGRTYVDLYEARNYYDDELPKNSCQYIRQAIVFPIGCFLINTAIILASLFTLFVFPQGFLVIGGIAALFACLILFMAIIIAVDTGIKKTREAVENTDNSVMKAIHDRYKKQICTLVRVEKEVK